MPIPLAYSYRSIAIRKGSSAMAVFGIALVVVVFVVMLALAEGFQHAVATSGSPDNLIILRKGADAELQSQVRRDLGRVIAEMPLVAVSAKGEKLFSFESILLFGRRKKDGGFSQLNVRGVSPAAFDVHEGMRLKEGRWFRWGTNEVAIGAALARRIEGFSVGQTLASGRQTFEIVGVFEAGGNGFESEVWLDGEIFMNGFKRGDIYQSFVFRAAGDPAEAKKTLEKEFEKDPRLRSMQALVESEYYYNQSKLMSQVIVTLGGFLTLIMSIGAIVGAMNTMYAAVAQRKREIGCLMSMGFTPESIWGAFIAESLCLSLLGAIVGCLLSLFFNGLKTGTTNWATFSETAFEFTVTPEILLIASALALGMGFVGGFLPALQASRLKVVEALRRA
ncbi:MAG: ABC transporter permease [Planctomycetes bacterium]|nr:ABC transporter permease [Planctomycetota bacterium]